jgi:hypothetical protein
MSDVQPSGTVTLVLTDVEGSTRLHEELDTDAYREALRSTGGPDAARITSHDIAPTGEEST